MAPIREILQKSIPTFFNRQHAEKRIPPQCPASVMTTIREILQKSFPTFFKRQARRKKHYVTMANSTTMSSIMREAEESTVS